MTISSSPPVRAAVRKRRRPVVDEVTSEDEPVAQRARRSTRTRNRFVLDTAEDEEEDDDDDDSEADNGLAAEDSSNEIIADSDEDEDEIDAEFARPPRPRPRARAASHAKSRQTPYRGDETDENDDYDLPSRKTKNKIHIPSGNTPHKATIEYGTQRSQELDSSPWRVRGPTWILPRSMDPSRKQTAASANPPPPARARRPATPPILESSQISGDEIAELVPSSPVPFVPPAVVSASPSRSEYGSDPAAGQVEDIETTVQVPSSQERLERGLATASTSQMAGLSQADIDAELADLPSDAFDDVSDLEPSPDQVPVLPPITQRPLQSQRLVAPQTGLRQTTLFGTRLVENHPSGTQAPSQQRKVYNYRVDKAPEPLTHHELNREELNTWVYPTNLGTIRDYQYSIVRQGLFNNLLVALPTGLGKTFIAATIMLNFFRWTKSAQIVFVAPTKPLVTQQIDACFNIVGIPRSTTTLLTGEVSQTLREEEWQSKRVFFMTPQTLENDIRRGVADPKRIALLVVDEAHRATGNYAYVKVVNLIQTFNSSFRVLALTATPGNTVEAVQEVIDGLGISQVEIRTEDSLDIQPYVHSRKIDQVLLDPSDEMIEVQESFSRCLQPLVDKVCSQKAYYNRDPMSLTTFGLLKAKEDWFKSAGRTSNQAVKGMMNALFAILMSLAHPIKLLNMHGLKPFYENLRDFRAEVEEKGNKAGKNKKAVKDHPDFIKMMNRLELWLSNPDFVGHPKMTYLCDTILNHFMDKGGGRATQGAPSSSDSNTRVIVFSEYRASADEIVRILNRHQPLVRASVFVGQAAAKGSEGMTQTKQQQTIDDFKNGKYNVIVATSIGEEGLDIGQVDLIVCYDASSSPIRMLQRMGRTGRKRAGNIVLLLMRGKEEMAFSKAKDSYEGMQKLICAGDRFNFRHDISKRIVPPDIKPEVDKRVIEIPIENTQNPGLPEPKRRGRRAQKSKPKKFHMPDGVETGFVRASKLKRPRNYDEEDEEDEDERLPSPSPDPEFFEENMEVVPTTEEVKLSDQEQLDHECRFLNVDDEIEFPVLSKQHVSQRSSRPTKYIRHGTRTEAYVAMAKKISAITRHTIANYKLSLEAQRLLGDDDWLKLPYKQCSEIDGLVQDAGSTQKSKSGATQRQGVKKKQRCTNLEDDESSDTDGTGIVRHHVEEDYDRDLSDFVVDDDEEIVFDKRTSRSSVSTSPPEPQPDLFFKPTFTASQLTNDEEDDEIPDFSTLVASVGKSKNLSSSTASIRGKDTRPPLCEANRGNSISTSTINAKMSSVRGRKRATVIDDSDE